VVATLAEQAAARWAAPALVREVLVAGILLSALYGVRQPASLLVTVALGAWLVLSVHRSETVTDVLGPYVAAAVSVFGPGAASVLCDDLTRPRRRDRPIAWLLTAWEERLLAARRPGGCEFGKHILGCPHCPFRVAATDTRCWPAPFNAWLARMHTTSLCED
jgi:hypothetical protein